MLSAVMTVVALVAGCSADVDSTDLATASDATVAPTPTSPPIAFVDPTATPVPTPDPDTAGPATEAKEAESDTAPATEAAMGQPLVVEFTGLGPLGSAATYELWAQTPVGSLSLGRFSIDDQETPEPVGFEFPPGPVAEVSAVFITIEPVDDPDPSSSGVVVLAGDMADGRADMSVAHPLALGTDFAAATGTYLLGTPTTATTDDEVSGIWFITLPTAVGLSLPQLRPGWTYEGWVIIDGQPVTTGRFANPAAPDDFDGYSGDQGGPPLPGEDFIVNPPAGLSFPTDLRGSTALISVEPAIDDDPRPFDIRPLQAEIPVGIADHVVTPFGPGPRSPRAVASLGN